MNSTDIVIDTLVVGAGQAGVAMSEHLSNNNVPHLVMEHQRIAEAWRTGRWDSLVANGPAWHDRFPTLEFIYNDADEFVTKEQVADYFETYAKHIKAPIQTGVEVTQVKRNAHGAGFTIKTSQGNVQANHVVAATGPFQHPVIPPIAPQTDDLTQLHSASYRNPSQIGDGAVLVIGAGSSGVQIADELRQAGKDVYLSVGAHDRIPRAYRQRDFVWWLGVLGEWDREAVVPGKEHVTIAISGADGGKTIDFRRLASEGIHLLGLTQGFAHNKAMFADDLAENMRKGDQYYFDILDAADRFAERNGLELPEDPAARQLLPLPKCVSEPIRELDLSQAGIKTIIWATGYKVDYGWLDCPDALDNNGKPRHQRGVSNEQGIYFVGLPWLSSKGSSFIWGVWRDAKHIADHIAKQRGYMAYQDASQR